MQPMKATVRNRTVHSVSILLAIAVLLSATQSSFGCPLPVSFYAHDTVMVQEQNTSKKERVKIYPNATHDVLFFSVRGVEGRAYQLFLFDVEGKLVTQANIKNKQTTVLENIEKGNYLFEVFSNDKRIENGQVTIQ
jgi:hypothetical protein